MFVWFDGLMPNRGFAIYRFLLVVINSWDRSRTILVDHHLQLQKQISVLRLEFIKSHEKY